MIFTVNSRVGIRGNVVEGKAQGKTAGEWGKKKNSYK
jgi:hypothetical protein